MIHHPEPDTLKRREVLLIQHHAKTTDINEGCPRQNGHPGIFLSVSPKETVPVHQTSSNTPHWHNHSAGLCFPLVRRARLPGC